MSCSQQSLGRRASCSEPGPREDASSGKVLMRMVRSVSIGLLVIFLAVYLGFYLHSAHVKSCVDDLKDKFMAEKELCEENIKENSGAGRFIESEKTFQKNEAGHVDEQHIRSLVQGVLNDFDVDKTGMTDFAMAALGGRVVSTPDTETYGETSIWNSPLKKGPATILEPSSLPGDCWAFAGKRGCVVIRLFAKIVVTNVTLEHIHRDLLPNGITSAPSSFSMVGLDDPTATTGHNYGIFAYKESGPPLQTFPVRFTFVPPFEYIKIDFQDNHGNKDFTCVYRIRIHGRRSDKEK